MNFSDPPKACQNQTTFVSHLLPQAATNVPDSRIVPAIVLVGGAAGIWALRLRSRRRKAAAPRP
jgi:hypothetical protein